MRSPIADVSKYLVEAATPLRWKVFRFPMRESGGDTIDSRSPLPPQPTPLVDVRGMKWILDGTPIERFALMREPYLDSPSERGRLNFSTERIEQFVGWAYGSEDPLAVHAVGDGAIDAYVSAIERGGRPEVWRAKRPRIEHGDLLSADLIARVKALGIVVVQNPLHFMLPDMLAARLGPQRMAAMQPMKSLLDARHPAGDRCRWSDEPVFEHHGGCHSSGESERGVDARTGGRPPIRPAPPLPNFRINRKGSSRLACWPTWRC